MMRRRVHGKPEAATNGTTTGASRRRRPPNAASPTVVVNSRATGVTQRAAPEEELLQGRFDVAQRAMPDEELQMQAVPEEEPLQGRFEVAQRYTVVATKQQKPSYWHGVGAPLRVADDGKMAVKHIDGTPKDSADHQVFFATGDVIANSQQALAATGSAFTIDQGNSTIVGPPPGDQHAPARTLYRAVTTNTDLARIGKGDQTFNVCSANLSNFLGVLRSVPADSTKLEQRRDVVLKLVGSLDHAQQSVVVGEDLGVAMTEARKIVTGEQTTGRAREAYHALKESMRKQISTQYGIDERALPDVGQGFGIIQGGKGGRSGMGHFAPVIAVSGHDRVTLENDVGQTVGRERHPVGQTNPNWYFRMFGPVKKRWHGDEDQTFWGEAKQHERGEYGDRPLVATLGSNARAQVPNGDD